MREPQEIDDEEHEQVLDRVAAIDVAKASGMVCIRVPHDVRPGRRRTRVWTVEATTNAILELAGYLEAERIEKVTLEATSDYWRIWFYLLEAAGLEVQLVNARDVKAARDGPRPTSSMRSGRPSAPSGACCGPASCPPLRSAGCAITPGCADLTRERTRHYCRLEKLLEDALIKVSAVASSLTTVSARDMIESLIAGERDPKVLAGLARGRMRAKHTALTEALTGRFDDHHAELAQMLLDQIDVLTAQIGRLTARIEELIAAIPAAQGVDADGATGPGAGLASDAPVLPALGRLDEIPGISRATAQGIIAEIGLDMTRFPTASHLVSWAKLSPRTIQSGPKNRAGKDRQRQPLPQSHPRRGRRSGRPHRHLPRRALPADRPPPWQAQSPGRHRRHHPGDHLAPAHQPRRPLPRARRRLLRQPDRQRPQGLQPHPPTRSARIHRHPGTRCLTSGNTGPGSANAPPGATARSPGSP
jgi:transposase